MAAAQGPLLSSLTNAPHTFLQPTLPLYTDTLAYLKHALDPLAADVSATQQQRQQEARKKRKRGEAIGDDEVLRIKQIYTDGFGPEQVWEQARRVIEAAREEAERGILEVEAKVVANGGADFSATAADLEEEDEDEDLGVEGVDYEIEGPDDGEFDDESEGSEDLDAALDAAEADGQDDYEDDDDVEMDGDELMDDDEAVPNEDEPAQEFVSDKFGLNDGFFSIDDFNKQSEFLEQQDTRGDDDGAASDEEDLDWDADPLAQAAAVGADRGAANELDEDDDAEEDGPGFGDPDAPSEDEDDEVEGGEMDGLGDMGMGNTNNVMYTDFFAPPAQKKRPNKKGRPNPHNFPAPTPATGPEAPDTDAIDRTREAVHRDLFEDDESEDGEIAEEGEAEQLDPSDPRSRRSAHERRKAALAEEIRKLEAANVAKREWTLSGEARAADRPINSLLEEDLEFDRTGKPVPVITAEVSESIEELIKRRILAHDFQDIMRRRPDDLATAPRRGRLDFELDDAKSKKGLAEEYEEEHLRQTDPNFIDVKDEKLKKEEKEIEALWQKVRADLDGLSSWHFRPKAPAPQLDIRVDAPTITMEDARPSAGAGGEASQLAPQEVYKAGTDMAKEEVAGKSGLPAAREEMSREERKRRRRREKERIRKTSDNAGGEGAKTGASGKKKQVVDDLKRGGVKVIGKKGVVTDVEGREAKRNVGEQVGGGRFKL